MKVIYVDDDALLLDSFKQLVRKFPEVEKLSLFSEPLKALEFAKKNKIDIAFLDIDMPMMNGIVLANELHRIDQNIRVIFLTGHSEFALEAFKVDAIGYVLKPYSLEDIRKEFDKALLIRSRKDTLVTIETIPDLSVKVRGQNFVFNRPKVEELFALLVDHGDVGLTTGEAIANLWPDRPNDENTSALYRTTAKRLIETLKSAGISDILCTDGRRRYIDANLVECDLYQIIKGDEEPLRKYNGEYLRRYGWAEEKNAWLWHLDNEHIK